MSIILAAGFVIGAVIVGLGAFYLFSAKDVEISAEIEASILTIHDAAKWFDLEVNPEFERWESDFYIDQSAAVSYYYNDWEKSIYLNCNLSYEPKHSDALFAYEVEWGALKLQNRIAQENAIGLEHQSGLFQWGEASRFAFQIYEGERYGLAFVARKAGKVFFLDCWGMVLEDKEDIAAFLEPHLIALERAEFRRKKTEKNPAIGKSDSGL